MHTPRPSATAVLKPYSQGKEEAIRPPKSEEPTTRSLRLETRSISRESKLCLQTRSPARLDRAFGHPPKTTYGRSFFAPSQEPILCGLRKPLSFVYSAPSLPQALTEGK